MSNLHTEINSQRTLQLVNIDLRFNDSRTDFKLGSREQKGPFSGCSVNLLLYFLEVRATREEIGFGVVI